MLERIVEFYKNLLIIQYNNQPRAAATIDAVVQEALADTLFFDVRDGFNIDTAVGKQLDVIGKYVGVDRSYKGDQFPGEYFSLVEYGEPTPYDPDRRGLIEQSEWLDDDGSFLTYDDIVSTSNLLNDTDYRVLIKLKILFNNMNVSVSQIDQAIFDTFGEQIVPDSTGHMRMLYFVQRELQAIASVAIEKNLLPKPAAVRLQYLVRKEADMFSLATYDSQTEQDGFTGFTTQADFDTQEGEMLTYKKLTEV